MVHQHVESRHLLCLTRRVQHRFLDSLVVRISACHVEGPGSIPGRGEHFLYSESKSNILAKQA